MKIKRLLAMLLAVVMVFALVACSGNTESTKAPGGDTPANPSENPGNNSGSDNQLAGTYEIKVWCADNIVELTTKQIDDFNKNNTDGIVIKATVQAVGEGDAATQMITDVEAGGDLFCFAQDQFARLVQAGALAKLGKNAAEIVKNENDEGAVKAVTIDGDIYAYPMTADNTYFMYYDKSVVSDEAAAKMDDILAACETAKKYVAFDAGNAWYMASYFFGAGCVSEWWTDKEGHWNLNDDFNSDKGLIAMKGLNKLMNSPMFLSKSNAAELDAGAAVVISGTWDSGTASKILGDNLGVAPLPVFTVDGTDYQLKSFMGYKLMGVKPQTDAVRAAALNKLAQYLTGEQAQLERHAAVGWGPANLKAQDSDAVKNDPVLSAVVKQAQNSVVQGQVNDGWWNAAAALGTIAKEKTAEADYKAALEDYANNMEKLKNLREGLLFVGAWNGWNNADETDTYIMKEEGGVYTLTLDVPESDYMGGRIVNIGSWENDKGFAQVTTGIELVKDLGADNPDNNIVFAEAGNYTVTWDGTAVTIVKN